MEPQLSFEEALLKVATSQTGVLIASGRDENPVGWKAIYDFVEQANRVASVVNPNLVAFYIAYHDTQSGNTIWSMDMSLRVTLRALSLVSGWEAHFSASSPSQGVSVVAQDLICMTIEGDCDTAIEPGEAHAECPSPKPATPPCSVCWLVHPEGACDR